MLPLLPTPPSTVELTPLCYDTKMRRRSLSETLIMKVIPVLQDPPLASSSSSASAVPPYLEVPSDEWWVPGRRRRLSDSIIMKLKPVFEHDMEDGQCSSKTRSVPVQFRFEEFSFPELESLDDVSSVGTFVDDGKKGDEAWRMGDSLSIRENKKDKGKSRAGSIVSGMSVASVGSQRSQSSHVCGPECQEHWFRNACRNFAENEGKIIWEIVVEEAPYVLEVVLGAVEWGLAGM